MDGGIEIYLKLIESQSKICERFTNIERIDPNGGDGAHSIVFIANDSTIKKNKKVILKFFNPQLAENFYRRECFNREAKLLEKLKGQRNILPMVMVLSVLSLSLETPLGAFPIQFSFYASHKAKESIKAYIYNDKSNFLKSINYFRQICKAVQRIHRVKIFHRDLKPDNFLLYPFGYVCLSDFGSARDYIEGKALIEDYEVMEIGDPRYTSFELLCHLQADEEFHRKADFFSLRAILFEMFTKSVLSDIIFQGDLGRAVSLMRQVPSRDRNKLFDEIIRQIVVDNTLPSVRKINPKIPKQVAIEIDRLYKGLSNLDYKHREADFTRIFSKINLCEKLILYSNKLEKKETFMRNKKD